MVCDPDFERLKARLGRGDQTAAAEVFQRFARRLIGLARQRLDVRLRQKLDPEDVVQSVFRSFFTRFAGGQFDLNDWDGLWSLLTLITLRKCGHRVEHFRAACRDVRRESAPPPAEEGSDAAWEGIAREPTPAEAAVLTETMTALLRGLDERERRAVELRLQGHSPPDICAATGLRERTLYRLLERLRGRLERLSAEDTEPAPDQP
jgi:RNA polymerase sigma-70 factor (ECF subfamily)